MRCSYYALVLCLVTSVASAESIKILHKVDPIAQPSPMSCWAAAATMLKNWRSPVPSTIAALVKVAGPRFEQIYGSSFPPTNSGIPPADEAEFYRAIGLVVVRGLNPTIAKWAELLRTKGPLSITVDATPSQGFIHALVVAGLDGDGTPGATIVNYIDPADGKKHDVVFREFLKLYEGSANWPLQIMHNP
ncbi:papain like cysteine protease AvrRpt2 [Rhodopseudomonas thermotolerans]|jgi:hypothetical protein|uniref:Papain like cysteine protease AvrRpt2 n=2 Tax=Rhodopseudomonas TaxID=1073 RepID=A0A336K4W9_9BRAD|nr:MULTISPECIES: papain-like cysteine protease family protein [Rhodopseudomonas]RED25539.1 papain like cysteine protease AvrRpt2 [Rhodopseudomonas pentothenatexigens]REF90369.1 papain like cysteine protease AvrRpt2 [Rhodopseudomonas thermotolerans]SSW93151.1 papain like cysteine protease AvrRpt2 [Rhodopseudomonas pentothenatexigens]